MKTALKVLTIIGITLLFGIGVGFVSGFVVISSDMTDEWALVIEIMFLQLCSFVRIFFPDMTNDDIFNMAMFLMVSCFVYVGYKKRDEKKSQ